MTTIGSTHGTREPVAVPGLPPMASFPNNNTSGIGASPPSNLVAGSSSPLSTADHVSDGALPTLTSPADGADVDDCDSLRSDSDSNGFIDDTFNESSNEDDGGGGKVRARPAEFPSAQPEIRRFANHDELKYDEGYDSDGEMMYYDEIALDDDPDDISEDVIEPITVSATTTTLATTTSAAATSVATTSATTTSATTTSATTASATTISATTASATTTVDGSQLSEARAGKLKVSELKDELRKRGKGTVGNKSILLDRLIECIRDKTPVGEEIAERPGCMNGLDITACWVPLTRNAFPIPEPLNEDANLRPPTERDAPINPKYGFDEKFERRPFEGTMEKLSYRRNCRERSARKLSPTRKRRQHYNSDPLPKSEPRVEGGPNGDFIKKHNLDEHSHPMDWFVSLMPLTQKDNKESIGDIDVTGDGRTKFAMSNWSKYTSVKAAMADAGEPGHIFAGKYKPLTTDDIRRQVGVYILDGVAPTPQLKDKMKSQSRARTHGNDFVAKHVGPNSELKHKIFRHFFGCQNPMTIPPAKKTCPNFKVDEFFRWLRHIWKKAWVLGRGCSVDEQTCKMQGKSEYKTRCGKFKRLGDGLQCDCIADDGFTYDFYFRNEPVPQKWLDKGFCPMHARLLHMFANFKDVGHLIKMDNLFVAVKLALEAYSLPTRVGIHGVIRKSNRGVPPCVLQEDATGKKADKVRGTVLAAVLKGDGRASNLIVSSCFDQKPFYMLSHSAEEVTWVEHEKLVYSHLLKRNVPYKFLRLNLSHEYNFEMNDNDIADQLRLVYRIMRFQRNQKWWWALWLWGVEVTVVNAYKMMTRYCELKGVNAPYNHHAFQEKIAYGLIDPAGEWPRRGHCTPAEHRRKRKWDAAMRKEAQPVNESARAPKVSKSSLHPETGSLKKRLDPSLEHLPHAVPGKHTNAICQLHRFAARQIGKGTNIPDGARASVMQCFACGVNLCLPCFFLFHKTANLEEAIRDGC